LKEDGLAGAAHRFLECSQRIERVGVEDEMEEYEDAWRDLEAALKATSTPEVDHG